MNPEKSVELLSESKFVKKLWALADSADLLSPEAKMKNMSQSKKELSLELLKLLAVRLYRLINKKVKEKITGAVSSLATTSQLSQVP